MPELPDVVAYQSALATRLVGTRVLRIRVISPFVLRTFDPPIEAVEGRRVMGVERRGKRIIFALDSAYFLVVHLMIAGRFRWEELRSATQEPARPRPAKIVQASFEFEHGTLQVTEASEKKRASLHCVQGAAALAAFDSGGLDVLTCGEAEFAAALRAENRTLKRVLTDPRRFDGIGNAFSDEILHASRLSPILRTGRICDAEIQRLLAAARSVLGFWIGELTARAAKKFPGPGDVTAFRKEFAVHGKFGRPCPVCAAPVQRIVYAENETNYCAGCQTGGKVLADRSLSRLLKDDWPRSIEELDS